MQRIRTDISEREAYREYVAHLRARRCGCKPRAGVLCAEGVRLHGLWRAAEAQEREMGEAAARSCDAPIHDATPRDELFLRLDDAEGEACSTSN